MIEEVRHQGKVFALILRAGYEPEQISFVTPQDNSLQLGTLKHRRGAKIRPHIHKSFPKTINESQEVLHIEYGKVEAEFFESTGKKVGSAILNAGDTILLLSGGHGFNILEDSKIMEVKQGPYYGVKEDKEYLD